MKPQKILFFHSVTQIGGAETNIIKIAESLVNDYGMEVHFATLQNNGPMWEHCGFGKSHTEIGLFSKSAMAAIQNYKNLLQKYQFDCVLNFGLRVELFSRLFTPVFSPNTRIISNIRSTDTDRNIMHILLDMLTQFSVSIWAANSEAGKQAFVNRELINHADIQVIYNFIEADALDYSDSRTLDPTRPKIGILANIRKLKGHYDLILLCKALTERGISPTFICGGIDKTEGDFAHQVEKEGLNNYFHFVGYVSDKPNFFKQIDVFLLPSYLEGMPTVVLEAMNYGVPVIATDIDGIPEQVIHGVNGLLCTPGDIQCFVASMEILLNNSALRKQFIHKSHEVLHQKFSKAASMQKWITLVSGNRYA
jgi:glycosyltransferase involved in cell wall biosynthesis